MNATDTARHDPMKSHVTFLPHEARAVGMARRTAHSGLAALGVAGAVLDDVALVVSELVGNAVQHARPLPGDLLELDWWLDHDGVHLRVTDGGSSRWVELQQVSDSSGRVASVQLTELRDSGRGLVIVDQLAAAWGVDDESPTRHTVWALLTLPPATPHLRAVR